MAEINYGQYKQALESNGGLAQAPTDQANPAGTPVQGTFAGNVNISVPQLPKIEFPLEDLTFSTTLPGAKQDLNVLLSLKDGKGVKQNNFGGSQVLINSDRIILNSRADYLMLFGESGIAISSPGNVNIDADDAITIYGDDGLFLGVPGKGASTGNTKSPSTKAEATIDNEYEPLVLGTKLANILEDLLVIIKNATLLTPVGKAYFREDTMYELACLQSRIPEMLSTYGYVDGISHEAVDPPPTPPKIVTEPPTTITGTVAGTFTGTASGDNTTGSGASTTIASPLANQPDFFETQTLYNDTL